MMRRRVVVQRWPAVPTAPNTLPTKVMSRSASFEIMMALLPPNSSKDLPNLAPTAAPTALPILVDPVADTNGIRLSLAIRSPNSLSPITKPDTPSGTPFCLNTEATIFWQAMPHNGVFSDGFQIHTSPHTQASIAFQLHTATGKLKAEITPTIPNGCHCSYILCPGRSLCMVNPCNCRESPRAKSQMSIISCTSPYPSCRLLPISYETNFPKSCFFSLSASPTCRTTSPRFGDGHVRQSKKAFCAALMVCS